MLLETAVAALTRIDLGCVSVDPWIEEFQRMGAVAPKTVRFRVSAPAFQSTRTRFDLRIVESNLAATGVRLRPSCISAPTFLAVAAPRRELRQRLPAETIGTRAKPPTQVVPPSCLCTSNKPSSFGKPYPSRFVATTLPAQTGRVLAAPPPSSCSRTACSIHELHSALWGCAPDDVAMAEQPRHPGVAPHLRIPASLLMYTPLPCGTGWPSKECCIGLSSDIEARGRITLAWAPPSSDPKAARSPRAKIPHPMRLPPGLA